MTDKDKQDKSPVTSSEYIKREQARLAELRKERERLFKKSDKEFIDSLGDEIREQIKNNESLESLLNEAQKKGKTSLQIKKEIADLERQRLEKEQEYLQDQIDFVKKDENSKGKAFEKLGSPGINNMFQAISSIEDMVGKFRNNKFVKKYTGGASSTEEEKLKEKQMVMEEARVKQSAISNVLSQKISFDAEMEKENKEKKKEASKAITLPAINNKAIEKDIINEITNVINNEKQDNNVENKKEIINHTISEQNVNELSELESPKTKTKGTKTNKGINLSPLENIQLTSKGALDALRDIHGTEEEIAIDIESLVSSLTEIKKHIRPTESTPIAEIRQKKETQILSETEFNNVSETNTKTERTIEQRESISEIPFLLEYLIDSVDDLTAFQKQQTTPTAIRKNEKETIKADNIIEIAEEKPIKQAKIKATKESIEHLPQPAKESVAKAESSMMLENVSEKQSNNEILFDNLKKFLKEDFVAELSKQIANKLKSGGGGGTTPSGASSSVNHAGH